MFLHFILGLLRDGNARHGYALASEYQRLSGNPSHPANVGRELKKLKDGGLVTRSTNAPGDDDRRIPYAITPKGAEVFDRWMLSAAAVEDNLATWLQFIDQVPPDVRGGPPRWPRG